VKNAVFGGSRGFWGDWMAGMAGTATIAP
jgi:hypothetical protein